MTRPQPPSLTNAVRTIAVQSHGRYLIDSPHGAVATLVGFHGYQENAAIHLDVIRRIAGGRLLNLVSIQALNRFYTRASAVVAGWMTSEDRELVIADNIAYVNAVLDEVAGEVGLASPCSIADSHRASQWHTAPPRSCRGPVVG